MTYYGYCPAQPKNKQSVWTSVQTLHCKKKTQWLW